MRPDSSTPSRRDPLFDLWRGIALVDMAWVHLASYPIGIPHTAALWIGEHTRFAAGFFVLLAGLTVRMAFGAGLASANGAVRRGTVRRLLRRALLLLVVDRLAGVAFALIESLLRSGPGLDADRLLGIATFQRPGATGGLLLLYTMLLALTPALDSLRRRAGAPAVAASSLVVFTLAQGLGVSAHWPPWTFPLAHWQPLFVAGYLATPHLRRLRGRGGGFARRWLLVASAAVAGVFVLRSGPALGLDGDLLPLVVFRKVPLNAAELAWYAAASAFVLVASAFLFERSARVRRRTAFLLRLGRWSLVVYVAHLLVELPILAVLTWLDPSPALRASALLAIVAGLDAVARAADWTAVRRAAGAPRFARLAPLRRLVPVGGVVGSAVAAACTVVVLATPPAEPVGTADRPTSVADARHEDAPALADVLEDLVRLDSEVTVLEDEEVTWFDLEFEGVESPDGDERAADGFPPDDASPFAQVDDAEFTPPDAAFGERFEDGFEHGSDPFPSGPPPFGEMPIEEMIGDETEPVAN